MKKLLILIGALMLVGCLSHQERQAVVEDQFGDKEDYHIIVIDSCEYVYFYAGNGSWGSHKGNCKNHK